MRKGIVLNAAVPAVENSIEIFEKAVKRFHEAGIDTIEVFLNNEIVGKGKKILDECGMKGIYLAGIPLKRYGMSLCGPEENVSLETVSKITSYMNHAVEAGFDTALITSGLNPAESELEQAGKCFCNAVDALYRCYGEDFTFVMEPSDDCVDAKQYLGPTERSVKNAEIIRQKHSSYYLTLDTSHIAQLGEKVEDSLKLGAGVCRHLHLANCILKKDHPLYGDKHPMLDDENGFYPAGFLKDLYFNIGEYYPTDELLVSLEIIDRTGKNSGSMEEIISSYPWFFGKE